MCHALEIIGSSAVKITFYGQSHSTKYLWQEIKICNSRSTVERASPYRQILEVWQMLEAWWILGPSWNIVYLFLFLLQCCRVWQSLIGMFPPTGCGSPGRPHRSTATLSPSATSLFTTSRHVRECAWHCTGYHVDSFGVSDSLYLAELYNLEYCTSNCHSLSPTWITDREWKDLSFFRPHA